MAGSQKVKISKAALSYLLAAHTALVILRNDGEKAFQESWSNKKLANTSEDQKRLFLNEAMGLVWDDD